MSAIRITKKVKAKLTELKEVFGSQTFNEVIQILMLKLEKYENNITNNKEKKKTI